MVSCKGLAGCFSIVISGDICSLVGGKHLLPLSHPLKLGNRSYQVINYLNDIKN